MPAPPAAARSPPPRRCPPPFPGGSIACAVAVLNPGAPSVEILAHHFLHQPLVGNTLRDRLSNYSQALLPQYRELSCVPAPGPKIMGRGDDCNRLPIEQWMAFR